MFNSDGFNEKNSLEDNWFGELFSNSLKTAYNKALYFVEKTEQHNPLVLIKENCGILNS